MLTLGAAPVARAGEDAAKLNPRVVAMADNTWLNLKPERNPKGRAYSGPCFGGGKLFYFGGGHFSYTYNDVELFDPVTNTWKKTTKPERPAGEKVQEWHKAAGEGASPSGAPYITHTYQYTSWDPLRKKFLVPLRQCGTWEFDPAEAKWENIFNVFKDPPPKSPHNLGAGVMAGIHSAFVPELGKPAMVITQRTRGIYTFDYASGSWKLHKPLPKALTGLELYSTYVDEWKAHLFAGARWRKKQPEFTRVDLAAGTAEVIRAPESIGQCHAVAYDSANKVVIAMPVVATPAKSGKTVATWALDVKTMKWTEMKPAGPPKGRMIGTWAPLWYDAAHNAHIFLNAVDRGAKYEGGKTETWAYRYKGAAEGQ
jgi:hypothetical protein